MVITFSTKIYNLTLLITITCIIYSFGMNLWKTLLDVNNT